MEQKTNEDSSTTSPGKQMKSRSKSTEEIQQQTNKKTFSSQKSLPGGPDMDKVKDGPECCDTHSSSCCSHEEHK